MDAEIKTYNIFYDKGIKAVVMEWQGYATSEQFREGTELMLNTLIKNNASKVLADIKGMEIIGMEDQKWLDSFFLPRAIDHGFKAIALLQPDNYFNKVAVESISYKVEQDKLKINFFDDPQDARNWLKNI